jgi:hypothetical protein
MVFLYSCGECSLIATVFLLSCFGTPCHWTVETVCVCVLGFVRRRPAVWGDFPDSSFFFFLTPYSCFQYSVLVINHTSGFEMAKSFMSQWKKTQEVKSMMVFCSEVRLGDDTWYWSVGKQPLAFGCEFSGLISLWIQNMLINGHIIDYLCNE